MQMLTDFVPFSNFTCDQFNVDVKVTALRMHIFFSLVLAEAKTAENILSKESELREEV